MAVAVWTSFQQIADTNGVPYNGAKVTVYAAGTTTKLTVYSDSALSVEADNPIICDSAGQHAIRYIATASYKTTITTSADAALTSWSKDNIDPGVAVGSGALAVASGGTGGTTAGAARTNLAAAAQSDMTTAQTDISNLQTWAGYNLTTASRMASGTTAQRPAAATAGKFRYNSTTGRLERDNGSAWAAIVAGDFNATTDAAASSGLYCLKRSKTAISSGSVVSATIPLDTTIPQIGEGTEISSVSFTPNSASSSVRIRVLISYGLSAAGSAVYALFINGAANAVAAMLHKHNAIDQGQAILEYEYSPGSTSAITIAVRAGSDAAIALNTSDGTNFSLGGVRTSSITVEEWLTP